MDIEELRSKVQAALKRMSAERIASEAGSITAKSVLNFASGDVSTPRHEQREALERFVGRPNFMRRVRESAVKETLPPIYQANPVPDSSWQLVMKTMVAQSRLVAELAEKTREAQEPVIRFLEQMDEMYKRPADAPAPTGEPVTPSQAVADMNAATQEEMAAREAKASRRRKGTG